MGQILALLFIAALAYYIINKIRYSSAKKKFEDSQAKQEKRKD